MLLHIFIIVIQCTAAAAFLILWYFWLKKKLLVQYMVQDEEQILFPFRHFSWVLLGLLVITSVAQIHFVRRSAQTHERFLAITGFYQKHEFATNAVEELKTSLEKLRKDMFANFGQLRAQQMASARSQGPSGWGTGDLAASQGSEQAGEGSATPPGATSRAVEGFGGEARASSLAAGPVKLGVKDPAAPKAEAKPGSGIQSMKLSCMAKVTAPKLRVRKAPDPDAPVIDSLSAGQEVKVTEKRLTKDTMWFRVITPSGLAGWVNYRFLKVEIHA
jgi:hypothetical protein